MLSNDQRGVLIRMLAALAISVTALTAAVLWPPRILLPPNDGYAAFEAALRWDLLVGLSLLVAIMRLARHRFFTPEDIAGGGASTSTVRAKELQALLQNTLEQVVLAVVTHAVWAVAMPHSWQAAVPVAVFFFITGRVLFMAGYARGAPARALGFALTFYPTAVMLILLLLRSAADILPVGT